MKKLAIIGFAVIGLAAGAFAQGGFYIDNTASPNGVTLDGNFYDGPAGMEVWYKNDALGLNVAAINSLAGTPSEAYSAMTGFTLATSFTSVAVSGGGFSLGDLRITGPSGTSPITIAVAMWQGTANSFGSATRAGVLAWLQPVNNFVTSGTLGDPYFSDAPAGFQAANLELAPVPEPTTLALAGIGAAALMIFRRRK